MTPPDPRAALWALLFGNMVIGTGVLLPAGMLTAVMADLGVTAGRAGLIMTVGGLVVGFGAPLFAALTSRVDRRMLLAFALSCYIIGHIGAALSADLTMVLVFRAVTVIGAAIFTPQAAATVGLIVPPDQRGSAIAFIFVGWSLASVLGIPLGSVLADVIGWRATFVGMAGLAAIGVAFVWGIVPKGLRVAPLNLSAWGQVLSSPVFIAVLLVTFCAMAGQFTLFTYITPVLQQAYGVSGNAAAVLFLIGGSAGVLASIGAGRLAKMIGLDRGVILSLLFIAAGQAMILAGWGNYWMFLLAVILWNIGGFAVNSLQQARLVALGPTLASATVALNTSFVYLGQSAGSAAGGVMMAGGATPTLAVIGIGFAALGVGCSVVATRLGRG